MRRRRTLAAATAAAAGWLLAPTARAWQRWDPPGPGPAPRAGALVAAWNGTLVVFGGRGDDARAPHDPHTFEISKVNGSFVFATFDGKQVRTCDAGVSYHDCYDTDVGTRFNDVWALPLACVRPGGGGGGGSAPACGGRGWSRLLAGAKMGGCKLVGGVDVCSHPCERVSAGGGVLRDGTLFVYGGYGEMCEDYCADVWTLDVGACLRGATAAAAAAAPGGAGGGGACAWVQHMPAGASGAGADGSGAGALVDEAERLDAGDALAPPPARPPGPGKRRGMAHALLSPPQDGVDGLLFGGPPAGGGAPAQWRADWVMFGGHRLWHGFAPGNELGNRWNDSSRLPFGGYLDDLWTATWERGAGGRAGGTLVWRQVRPRESCYARVGATWEARGQLACAVEWPPPRAGGALAQHGRALFLHGGYGVGFPYPQVLGRGSGPGTASLAGESRGPYPSRPCHLADLWRYEPASGLWRELTPAPATAGGGGGSPWPTARRGHSLSSLGPAAGALLLVGGSSGTDLLGETWLFHVRDRVWVRRRVHARPLLPPNCTSDVLLEGDDAAGVATAAHALERLARLQNRSGSSADADADAAADAAAAAAALARSAAAGGPFITQTRGGGTLVALGASVAGEPTRGLPQLPRLRVPQPRRRAPGWDGCRDRADGRADLPAELQWLHPGQRAEHGAVVVVAVLAAAAAAADSVPAAAVGGVDAAAAAAAADAAAAAASASEPLLVLLGGDVLPRGQEAASGGRTSHATRADGGLWTWRPGDCPSGCSGRGACALGFCVCRPGWYGVDCSNATCPGDWTQHDPLRQVQRHTPCCSAAVFLPPPAAGGGGGGGDHTSAAALGTWWADPWAPGAAPRPPPYHDAAALQQAACSERVRGRSRGTCDGFGGCQCVPPFVGPDCALLDCPRNCSGRGACALEFPVGRCLCDAPASGADCSLTTCLNNCSWPRGACNTSSGECACAWATHPQNRSQRVRPYGGADCSVLAPAAAAGAAGAPSAWAVAAGVAAAVAVAVGGGAAAGRAGARWPR